MSNLETIKSVEEIHDFSISKITPRQGESGAQEGIAGMLDSLCGGGMSMDGFKIQTSKHTYMVLISNEQNCCERWGYVVSEDNLPYFIGANLREVSLVDTALNTQILEKTGHSEWGFDGGGIQFVNFSTSRGVIQFAVYNSHNGYYGHGIVIAKDENVLKSDCI